MLRPTGQITELTTENPDQRRRKRISTGMTAARRRTKRIFIKKKITVSSMRTKRRLMVRMAALKKITAKKIMRKRTMA